MQSAAGPPGGSNPKRATGRSHRSADGASPAALDRSPRKWPDRPTRTAWPLPPLSAAQFAPSSLSGSSWHPSDSSRRRRRLSTPSQPVAGSHGSLFLSTSLNFDTARLQRGTTIVLPCCSLTFPTAALGIL
ncbi:hypothetical protein EMIHUDRAFT_254762 [Emiliania huxleyi CCMP1516]|uniref:Uncharacterized protein n=2 Tax=Emiliania huxleyi TaxID=2903 RepID=A0A0D3JLT4_EMIH1|nr:hypothetical protein EMIHUDRAFT_254762 [Emiliania huxleyi CCMP1516]EOD24469.1 hypothetical protein EMIHUDRAFT_254762 [Emiliania huxleyi CCMP1516]|eukprot:XP_005776898.1 hypothetical protein EMIHUDRAFT_254762 [Emiliania huxleyi CCMP1516]